MKNLKLLILFAFAIIISSCGDDDPCQDIVCQNQGVCIDGTCDCPDGFEGDLCQEKKLLLKSISLDGVIEESFTYNDDRSIATKIEFENEFPLFESNYRYTSDSIICETYNHFLDGSFSTRYNRIDSDQIKAELFDEDSSVGSYRIYNSFDQDCGYGRIDYYNYNNTTTGASIYDFTDAKCSSNLTRTNAIDNSIIVTVELKNDDKNSYEESTKINYLKSPNRGNLISFIVRDENGEVINSSSYTSTYTYNDDDYPTAEIREYFHGLIQTRTFDYY